MTTTRPAGLDEDLVLATSKRTGIGAHEILAGLEASFNRFGSLDTALANIDRMADVALATGSNFESVGVAANEGSS